MTLSERLPPQGRRRGAVCVFISGLSAGRKTHTAPGGRPTADKADGRQRAHPRTKGRRGAGCVFISGPSAGRKTHPAPRRPAANVAAEERHSRALYVQKPPPPLPLTRPPLTKKLQRPLNFFVYLLWGPQTPAAFVRSRSRDECRVTIIKPYSGPQAAAPPFFFLPPRPTGACKLSILADGRRRRGCISLAA